MSPRNGENDLRRIVEGGTIPFGEYLRRVAPPRADPVIWRGRDLAARLGSAEVAERGTLALIDADGTGNATIAPGLSGVIQVVPPAGETSVHSHSFWHLCLVRSGSGAVSIGRESAEDPIREGDTLFIPAWCPHAFSNRGAVPLVMMVIQNLPGLADAGTVVRQNGTEPVEVVYGNAVDAH
jgi:gentisate 1,2-dioxygenase